MSATGAKSICSSISSDSSGTERKKEGLEVMVMMSTTGAESICSSISSDSSGTER